jgi:hypothetical protein
VNFHSQGLHGIVDHAPTADPTVARAPLASAPVRPSEGSGEDRRSPQRIPEQDILVVGRRSGAKDKQDQPVRLVPSISRRRLAVRLLLVAALIGETIFTVRTWPAKPIAVPDVSDSRSVIV